MTGTEQYQVVFHTNTDIDPRSWSVMGMHAKETDHPIGLFGSGMKYALAILLRTGHEVEIFNGDKHYSFGLTTSEFRGKQFEQITCNGNPLPFTTEYGRNWELWMAYRELVSNTMDEGGLHFSGDPMPDGTSIVVRGKEFHDLLARHDEFFVSDREPISQTSRIKIYKGNGTLYYRGVKVGTIQNGSYSYEFTCLMMLTEDRTLKNEWEYKSTIENDICKSKDKEFIRHFLKRPDGTFENRLDYDWTWSDEFTEVVQDIWKTEPTTLPKSVQKKVRVKIPDAEFACLPMEDYQESIDAAVKFLSDIGYNVTSEIKVVENKEDGLIAFYHMGIIHLTEKAFDKGLFYLIRAIYEEHCHHLGYSDCTRMFEDHLINELLKQGKKRIKAVF